MSNASEQPMKRIAPDVKLGENVRIFDFVNLYGCEIGDNTMIGPFVEIQRGVKIGKSCRIQSHAFICTGVTIEDNVFIGHGVVFTNDPYPRANAPAPDVPTVVGSWASIGSNATVLCGLTIGERAIVGAGAVVTKDVPPRTIVAGNPARVLRKVDD
jgi:UDP-2-acetamido-3-amino-2,3-dideoxy-glucuronate N-acetyltransferase